MTDFDGTLSPIVDVPSSARPLDGVPAVLARLADRFATVAVVSGRPVSFLWAHLGHVATAASGRLLLIGLYGMESAAPDGTVVLDDAAAAWVPAIVEVADRLRSDAPDGVLVEVAGPSVTVHWRLAPEAGDWVRERSAAEAAATGLGAHPGRRSVELRPPLAIDKGTVVRRLADGRRAVGFLGDDLGDLPAFAELARLRAAGGTATVGVAIVDQETSPEVAASADLSVQGPEGALAVLAWLAAAPVTGADR